MHVNNKKIENILLKVTLLTFTSVVCADKATDINKVNRFLCFKGIGVLG